MNVELIKKSNKEMDDDLEVCRTCGHFYFLHGCTYFNKYTMSRHPHDSTCQRCDPQQDHDCDCPGFIPEDNLKYLEWCYEHKIQQ